MFKYTTILILFSFYSNAQCAMCRAVLETGSSNGEAEAVNNGIVYLMVFPYLLVGIIAFIIYYKFFRVPKS
jgi:hypothetical protein